MDACDNLLTRRDAVFAAACDEDLFGGATEYSIEGKLPLTCTTQLEEQFATVVGQSVYCVDEAHLRGLIEMRSIGDVFEKDQRAAVEVGLSDEGDELLFFRGSIEMS